MTEEHEDGRVAVLSDIHGVLPALEAVLAEPEVAAADRIVLTGDITASPQPSEVIELLREQGERVLWVGEVLFRSVPGRRGAPGTSRSGGPAGDRRTSHHPGQLHKGFTPLT